MCYAEAGQVGSGDGELFSAYGCKMYMSAPNLQQCINWWKLDVGALLA